jgi:hypothetical protein
LFIIGQIESIIRWRSRCRLFKEQLL